MIKNPFEFARYQYYIEDVLKAIKGNKHAVGQCRPYEVYQAYVGRHDEPHLYDKRPCMIVEDLGDKVSVYKITSKNKDDTPLRYLIKNNGNLNFPGPSYIKMDEELHIIDKKWITMFDGDLKYTGIVEIEKLLGDKKIFE